MTARPHRRGSVLTTLALTAAVSLAAGAPPAFAGAIDVSASKIADSASLGAAGRSLQLGGVVRCSACRSFTLGATVSQGTSGAIAQGGVRCTCRGASERWRLTARTREATAFRAGVARVCVWVTARGRSGDAIDAKQWCENVELTIAAT